MFNFDLQRFGSTTVSNSSPVNGATQLTETGKEIEGINRDYLRVLSPILQNLANTGGAQVGTSVTPDYNSMYGAGMNQINAANAGINALTGQAANRYAGFDNSYANTNANYANQVAGANNEYSNLNNQYNGLVNGNLSANQQAVMQNAVKNATSPFATSFNNLAGNGIINSSVGKQWATDANTAGTTAALNSYSDIMNTANNAYGTQLSGINNKYSTLGNNYTSALTGLGQQASNYGQGVNTQSGLYNNLASAAANPYNYAAGFQSAAGSNAKDLLSLATGSYSPVGSTFSDYLKAGTGQQSSSSSTDNSGLFSLLGTGAGLALCFVAGTLISTPNGDTNIEDVTVGNIVSTLVGDMPVEKTIHTSDMPVVTVQTDKGDVTCTESEVLLTVDGPQSVRNLIEGDVLIRKDGGATVTAIVDAGTATVYEIVVPWFYANGFVVDGFDPEVK